MNLIDNIKHTYRQGNAVIRLVYINVAVYLLLHVFLIIMKLFVFNGDYLISWLALPSGLSVLMYKPWTFITYMFLHQDFFHILFNMFALYWFGRLFLTYFTEKQLFGLYFFGGLVSGLVYVVAYNVFPLFSQMSNGSILMGASGSIMAIIVATALQSPNLQMRFILIGVVKLKYIALAAVLISFFGITSSNAGGELAHLGGALYGYFFIVSLRRGKDHTKGFNRLMDKLSDLFKPRKLKVKHTKNAGQKMSDGEFNRQKAKKMVEIDHILDKIKTSGYGSLTAEERRKLFE